MPIIILFGIVITASLAWYIRKRWLTSHRTQLFNQPIPENWISLLEDNVSLYVRLPQPLKQQLHGCSCREWQRFCPYTQVQRKKGRQVQEPPSRQRPQRCEEPD